MKLSLKFFIDYTTLLSINNGIFDCICCLLFIKTIFKIKGIFRLPNDKSKERSKNGRKKSNGKDVGKEKEPENQTSYFELVNLISSFGMVCTARVVSFAALRN